MRSGDAGRRSGAASLQTVLLLVGAVAVAVLIAVALTAWFGRLS
ncbi:MAG: hypothetical protein ACLGIG_05065 [Actinomycetes bacterium]